MKYDLPSAALRFGRTDEPFPDLMEAIRGLLRFRNAVDGQIHCDLCCIFAGGYKDGFLSTCGNTWLRFDALAGSTSGS